METKVCNTCNEELPVTSFYKNDGGRRRAKCKICQRAYHKAHYRKHKKKYLARGKKIRKEATERNRQLIKELKDAPCVDCGKKYPYYVMDFDHVRGNKVAGLARLKNYSQKKILEEIEKCELVCANCHRIRTWKHLDDPQGD